MTTVNNPIARSLFVTRSLGIEAATLDVPFLAPPRPPATVSDDVPAAADVPEAPDAGTAAILSALAAVDARAEERHAAYLARLGAIEDVAQDLNLAMDAVRTRIDLTHPVPFVGHP